MNHFSYVQDTKCSKEKTKLLLHQLLRLQRWLISGSSTYGTRASIFKPWLQLAQEWDVWPAALRCELDMQYLLHVLLTSKRGCGAGWRGYYWRSDVLRSNYCKPLSKLLNQGVPRLNARVRRIWAYLCFIFLFWCSVLHMSAFFALYSRSKYILGWWWLS